MMKTLDFDNELNNADFERPLMIGNGKNAHYVGFVVTEIEEFNMIDKILGTTQRAYRIYWKKEDGKIKYFDCGLNTDTYKRFVIPNMGKMRLMRP